MLFLFLGVGLLVSFFLGLISLLLLLGLVSIGFVFVLLLVFFGGFFIFIFIYFFHFFLGVLLLLLVLVSLLFDLVELLVGSVAVMLAARPGVVNLLLVVFNLIVRLFLLFFVLFCFSIDLFFDRIIAFLGRHTLDKLSYGGSFGLLTTIARVIISDGFRFSLSLLLSSRIFVSSLLSLGICPCSSSSIGLSFGIGDCIGIGSEWDVELQAGVDLRLGELW